MANWQTRQVLTIDVDSLGLKSVQATAVAERIGVPSGCQRVAYAQGKGLGLRSGALHDHPTGADALFTRHWSMCLDEAPIAPGQRVEQGDSRFSARTSITDTMLAVLGWLTCTVARLA
jgi:hypothetical protein